MYTTSESTASQSASSTDNAPTIARRVVSLNNLKHTAYPSSAFHAHNYQECPVIEQHGDTTGIIVRGIERTHLDMVRRHRLSWSVPPVQDRTSSAPPTTSYSILFDHSTEEICQSRRASVTSTDVCDTNAIQRPSISHVSAAYDSVEDALPATPQSVSNTTQGELRCGTCGPQEKQCPASEDDVPIMLNEILLEVLRGEEQNDLAPEHPREILTLMAKRATQQTATRPRGTSESGDRSIEIVLDSPVSCQRMSGDLTEKPRASFKHSKIVSTGSTDWENPCRSRATTMTRPSSSAVRHHLNNVRTNPCTKRIWAVFWLVILVGATIGTVWFLLYNSPFSILTPNIRASNATSAAHNGNATTGPNERITVPAPYLDSDWRCNFLNLFNGSSSKAQAYSEARSLACHLTGFHMWSLSMLAIASTILFED